MLGHQRAGALEGGADVLRPLDADSLAAEALGHLDMVYAVAARLGRIDVVEGQLHAVVHVEVHLRLADQAEVGIVNHYLDEGHLELRRHGQFFDQELEIVVAGDGNHVGRRIGHLGADRGRQRPAQRACLAGVDPIARFVDLEELRRRYLRQADGGDVARVAAEIGVHFVPDAVRLHRRLIEIAPAQHGRLAALAVGDPGLARLEGACGLHLRRHGDQLFERCLGVGSDAEVGAEDAADLRRLDVDMHEFPTRGKDIYRAGVAVGPAVADAHDEVGGEHGGVAVAVRCLQADHAGHQRVIVGNGAPAHQRRNHRHIEQLGEFHQQPVGVGVEDAAAGDDQGPLGVVEHLHRLFGLGAGGGGLVGLQWGIGVGIEFDLGDLHVEGQVDQHRAWAARAHDVEGLLEDAGHQCRLAHRHRPLGHRLGDGLDVHGLEVLLVEPRARRLAGDAEDGNGIGGGRIEAGDHVGAGRARGADADADVAGLRPRVALGHVRRAFDVTGKVVLEAAVGAQRRVKRVDGGAGHAEGGVDSFLAQDVGGGVYCSHACHICLLLQVIARVGQLME